MLFANKGASRRHRALYRADAAAAACVIWDSSLHMYHVCTPLLDLILIDYYTSGGHGHTIFITIVIRMHEVSRTEEKMRRTEANLCNVQSLKPCLSLALPSESESFV